MAPPRFSFLPQEDDEFLGTLPEGGFGDWQSAWTNYAGESAENSGYATPDKMADFLALGSGGAETSPTFTPPSFAAPTEPEAATPFNRSSTLQARMAELASKEAEAYKAALETPHLDKSKAFALALPTLLGTLIGAAFRGKKGANVGMQAGAAGSLLGLKGAKEDLENKQKLNLMNAQRLGQQGAGLQKAQLDDEKARLKFENDKDLIDYRGQDEIERKKELDRLGLLHRPPSSSRRTVEEEIEYRKGLQAAGVGYEDKTEAALTEEQRQPYVNHFQKFGITLPPGAKPSDVERLQKQIDQEQRQQGIDVGKRRVELKVQQYNREIDRLTKDPELEPINPNVIPSPENFDKAKAAVAATRRAMIRLTEAQRAYATGASSSEINSALNAFIIEAKQAKAMGANFTEMERWLLDSQIPRPWALNDTSGWVNVFQQRIDDFGPEQLEVVKARTLQDLSTSLESFQLKPKISSSDFGQRPATGDRTSLGVQTDRNGVKFEVFQNPDGSKSKIRVQ